MSHELLKEATNMLLVMGDILCLELIAGMCNDYCKLEETSANATKYLGPRPDACLLRHSRTSKTLEMEQSPSLIEV